MGAGSSSSEGDSPAGPSSLASASQRPSVDPQFEEALAGIRQGEAQNVVLTGQRLGPAEIEELCQAFSCTESVEALELDSNMIGNEGAAHLAKALAGDDNINRVDLTDNGIGDEGALALAVRLQRNCALRHLDLTGNTIKGDGGVALARMLTVNLGIRELTLSQNVVGAEGARAIGSALPSNLSLQILNLRQCGLGPKGAKFIAQGLNYNHAVLTELSAGLNDIKDDGASEFAELIRVNRTIKALYLDDNGIEGFGAELMAEGLMNNDCLEIFWFVRNYLSVDVVAKLAKAAVGNKTLRSLGIASADDLPTAVVEDLQQVHRNMADRRRQRSVHDRRQDSRGDDSRQKGGQDIIAWDDALEVEELLGMASFQIQELREVHDSKGIAPVDLSDWQEGEDGWGRCTLPASSARLRMPVCSDGTGSRFQFPERRKRHASRGTAPVNLSDDVGVEEIMQIAEADSFRGVYAQGAI